MSSRMGSMQSFSAALGKTLARSASSDALAAKAARASKVKQMWREVVMVVCHPQGQLILDHTNSVYILREGDAKILIVYVDESIFAAELNAYREMIKLKLLERFGEEVEQFRICTSRGRYKGNYPFRDQGQESASEKPAFRVPLDSEKLKEIDEAVACIEDEKMRAALKKAMISDLEVKSGIKLETEQKRAL